MLFVGSVARYRFVVDFANRGGVVVAVKFIEIVDFVVEIVIEMIDVVVGVVVVERILLEVEFIISTLNLQRF